VDRSDYFREFPEDTDVASRVYSAWAAASGGDFWAAHLLRHGYDEDAVLSGFAVDEQAARLRFEELTDPDRWPTFPLPLGDGRTLIAVHRNFEEDEGVDYLLETDAGDRIRLATYEGGGVLGPGLSWGELRALLDLDAPVPAHGRLLMFLPATGEEGMAAEARRLVGHALRHLGAQGDVERLAGVLTEDDALWDLPRWRRDGAGNLVCDGEYSPRNPEGRLYNRIPLALPTTG
jgi:hypothetical protein